MTAKRVYPKIRNLTNNKYRTEITIAFKQGVYIFVKLRNGNKTGPHNITFNY